MFRKYFKLPVRRDSLTDIIWDSADHRIMNGVEDHVIPEDVLDELVNVINGTDVRYYIQDVSVQKSDTDCSVTLHINQELKYTMDIRGWGYLTGPCNLSPEEASRVQDSLADFIESTIKGTRTYLDVQVARVQYVLDQKGHFIGSLIAAKDNSWRHTLWEDMSKVFKADGYEVFIFKPVNVDIPNNVLMIVCKPEKLLELLAANNNSQTCMEKGTNAALHQVNHQENDEGIQ